MPKLTAAAKYSFSILFPASTMAPKIPRKQIAGKIRPSQVQVYAQYPQAAPNPIVNHMSFLISAASFQKMMGAAIAAAPNELLKTLQQRNP